MIIYTDNLKDIDGNMLIHEPDNCFFTGWPNPPSPTTHLKILQGSYSTWLAIDDATGKVVGFINAISDGVLSAYIPLLEVLPKYQGMGIGKELSKRMITSLSHLYMVDLLCDENLQPYYAKLGMYNATGMLYRNYDRQNGGEM